MIFSLQKIATGRNGWSVGDNASFRNPSPITSIIYASFKRSHSIKGSRV